MGMTYDEYWNQDPWLVKDYRDAYEYKKDELNAQAWLEGVYMYHAIAAVLGQAFGKKSATYLEEPINFKPRERTAEEIRDDYVNRLKTFMGIWNERHSH